MTDTQTTVRITPNPVGWRQVVRAMHGQPMRALWKSGLLILTLTGFFVIYLILKPGGSSPEVVTGVDNVIQGLLEVIGLLLTLPLFFSGIARTGQKRVSFAERVALGRIGQRWVPVLLGLAILCHVSGQAIWTYNENIAHLPVLFPSWADAGYLGFFPIMLLALLLLPAQPLPAITRTRIALNLLLIMVAVTTMSWYFILGPTLFQGTSTVLGKIIGTAYPLATLLLIFCLLLLYIHSHDHSIRPVVFILGLALLIIVLTDSIYDYQQLHGAYVTGTLLDVGWPLGYMLVGLGARAMRVVSSSRPRPTPAPDGATEEGPAHPVPASLFWQSLTPFLVLPPIVALLGYTMASDEMLCPVRVGAFLGITADKILCPLRLGVILGTAALLGLLILRQVVVIRQAIRGHQKLWAMRERVIRAELAREKAERLKVERILALNTALAASQQATPHARILAFGHYQIRDSSGIYYNVYHREAGDHQTFECECPQYEQQAICPHSLTAAALHSVSGSPQH